MILVMSGDIFDCHGWSGKGGCGWGRRLLAPSG